MNPKIENPDNNPTAPTWVVDEANGLSELEIRLNHLEGEGFAVRRVFLLQGLQPQFVILACHARPASPRIEMRAVLWLNTQPPDFRDFP